MDKIVEKLTVFFEDPFWVGVIEKISDGALAVCKITFGAEPKDYEVLEFINRHYDSFRFSPSVDTAKEIKRCLNPKRLQREVKKQMFKTGIGTKSQQALKLQQEQGKLERKQHSREQREAKKEFQFTLKQQKRKEKHKGR